jgi:nucleoside-diphosphate-sugar epimerase
MKILITGGAGFIGLTSWQDSLCLITQAIKSLILMR